MTTFSTLAGAGIAAALFATSALSAAPTPAAKPDPKLGSAHVQCDGEPNNVTGGETAARLIGAVTLLGLFAPAPEAADASKRKFGAEGVAVCTTLIEGEKKEGNAKRRLGLILARAIHRIEAKNPQGALADVALARGEAQAAGFMDDPYFARTRGRSFDLVESAALLRMGKPAEAREAALRMQDSLQYSVFGLASLPDYGDHVLAGSPAADLRMDRLSRLLPGLAGERAARLELQGRFADAARVRDALVEFDTANTPEFNSSVPMMHAALSHALAGNAARAEELAAAAKANADKRKADGKPESDLAELVELTDLYGIVRTAGTGDLKTARRLFSARSEWVGASLGSVAEVNRRLRNGAAPDELVGGLQRDADALWAARAEVARAELLAKDGDNKTLFHLVPGAVPAAAYEGLSKQVWRTEKSKLVLNLSDKARGTSKMETMFLYGSDPRVVMDAYTLHAALLARSRGHEGFVIAPAISGSIFAASFRTGAKGEPGLPADLFLPAEDVIAKLSPLIPDPAALKARKLAAAGKR